MPKWRQVRPLPILRNRALVQKHAKKRRDIWLSEGGKQWWAEIRGAFMHRLPLIAGFLNKGLPTVVPRPTMSVSDGCKHGVVEGPYIVSNDVAGVGGMFLLSEVGVIGRDQRPTLVRVYFLASFV